MPQTLERHTPIDGMADEIHASNVKKGFYADRDAARANDCLAVLMLITTEVAELAEEVRKRKIPKATEDPNLTTEEIEAADVLIRLLDYASWRQLRLGAAVRAKIAFNQQREHKHGKRA